MCAASASRTGAAIRCSAGSRIRRIELREATAAGSDAEYREEDFR
ncbi:hypothetical protein ACE1N8_34855 (plasmid) [Streptomyces sp. DSM 116494]